MVPGAGAWVHIMQHASNHRPATIDANIQLSAWLTVEAAEGLLNTITASVTGIVQACQFLNQYFDKHEHSLFGERYKSTASSLMKQFVSP